MKYLAAMVMPLTPVAMVMILGLYLLRHRRELKQARDEGAYCDEIRDRGATKTPPVLATR